jgi:hypothetical protein
MEARRRAQPGGVSRPDLRRDICHKADISGGAAYAIALPDPRADAPLENVMILLPGPPVRGSVPERVATKRNVRDVPAPQLSMGRIPRLRHRW